MLQICRNRYELIFNFTIYGERHSGTNFLEKCIKQQFGLDLTYFYDFKHFFGWRKPEAITYKGRHTLFIGIVRNPYDWISAFYVSPHNVPSENRYSIHNFVTKEWYSVNLQLEEILQDRNFTKKSNPPRYKNIFELRNTKCLYLSHIMPAIANNYVLISYDTFLRNHKLYLNLIMDRFNLKKVGEPPEVEKKTPYGLDNKIKEIIDNSLDWSLEESLGYFKK